MLITYYELFILSYSNLVRMLALDIYCTFTI